MSASKAAKPRIDELRQFPEFADLSEPDLAWIAERSDVVELETGETLIAEGAPADVMILTLAGELHARRERGAGDGRVFVARASEISGALPFSRMERFPSTSRAVVPSRVALLPKAWFPEMLERIPVLEPRLVALMTDRVRESTRAEQQQEKLVALGKLSAGLAHELNNPAAAARRSVDELNDRLTVLRESVVRLADHCLEPAQMRALADAQTAAVGDAGPALGPLERSEREDELTGWLDEHGVADGWRWSPTLVAAGADRDMLERFAAHLPAPALPDALQWLEAGLAADGLLREVQDAVRRISELVAAVKTYSHMDGSPSREETDVHAGLDSTLTMLAHAIREREIQIERDYAPDLPRISAYPGELNQVWTNLLDNALDAAPAGGHVRIRTARDGDYIRVEIHDNGPGIPPEIRARIWEPFFTTKDVGDGTGLGLDIARRIIVRRHGGTIDLASEPGDTCFLVRLPIVACEVPQTTGE